MMQMLLIVTLLIYYSTLAQCTVKVVCYNYRPFGEQSFFIVKPCPQTLSLGPDPNQVPIRSKTKRDWG